MHEPFTLLIPLREGLPAETLPGLQALMEHAAARGHPLRLEGVLTLEAIGGVQMVQLTLQEAAFPPGRPLENITPQKRRSGRPPAGSDVAGS